MVKKKLICIILIILILFVIIAYFVDMNRMKNNRSVIFSTWGYNYTQTEENELNEPPQLKMHLENSTQSISSIRGTYSWKKGNLKIQADSLHPSQFEYKEENTLKIINEKIIIDNSIIKIKEANIYNINSYDKIDSNIIFDKNTINLDIHESGEYALEIIVEYPQGTVCYGVKIIKEDKLNEANYVYGIITQIKDNYIIIKGTKNTSSLKIDEEIYIDLSNKPEVIGSFNLVEGQTVEILPESIHEVYPSIITTKVIKII